ncbi:MAG TPA: translocation/assembly module TamB domain-containing protein [Candidatus Wallbacteria bacterium]|nr:translocation/assembly module TamB domain-containing protein [Candidatus Wallbacteria bacterium]
MKTPKQLIKLFFGTLLFTFLTVVLSAYIFANTFLKHYLISELNKIFPADLKAGYIASDLFSFISMKKVSLRNQPGKTITGTAGNTCEVSFDSLSLTGSVFDAIAKKADMALHFSGLKLTLKSDGKKIFFPDCLGINELDINAGGNSAFLNFFKMIKFENCDITVEVYDAGFKELQKSLSLNKFSADMWLADRQNLKFKILSNFEYNDEMVKLENVSYEGALNVNNMVLDGRLKINESTISNSIFKNSPLIFNAKFSCDYDFTLYISMLGKKISEYLSGQANIKVSGGNVRLKIPFYGEVAFNGAGGAINFNPARSTISFNDFSARAYNSHIDVSGEVDLDGQKIDMTFKSPEFMAPVAVKKFETLEVALSADVRLNGDYGNGRYSIVSAAPKLSVLNFKRKILTSLTDVSGEIIIEPAKNIFKLERFNGAIKNGSMAASFSYDTQADKMSGNAEAKNISIDDFDDLLRHFGIAIDRRLAIKKIDSDFKLDFKDSGKSLIKGAGELSGYSLADGVALESFDYEYKTPVLSFAVIRFASPLAGRENTARGSYDVSSGEYSFKSKDFLVDLAHNEKIKNLSGMYAVNVSCEGGMKKYKIDFNANIRQLKFNGKPVNFAKLSGRIGKSGDTYSINDIAIDDCITIRNGTIDKNSNFNLDASLYEVSVGQIKNFVAGESFAKLTGTASGKISASGNLYELDKVTTTTELKKIAFAYDKIKINNISGVKIKNHKTRLDFDSFNIAVNGHSVKIDGFVDYAGSGEVALKLKLDDTDLKMLKLYAGEYIDDISGKCDIEGKLNGALSDVKFDGAVGLNAKSVKFKGFSEPVSDFNIQLESKNYDIAVKKGSFKFGGTDWEIGGKAIINYKESPLFLDLIFECKNMKLDIGNQKALVEGSSRLGLKGEITKPRLYGSCRVTKAKIELTQEMFKTKKEPVKVGPVELDIIIFADKNVWLTNNFINAELKGKFNIKTVKENLAYTGDIATVRGVVNFNGHEFQIDNGKLQFNDNPAFDPLFNIDAHTNIDIFKILLQISGSTSKPNFQLSSQPALTQPEITALLTTGRAQNDLNSKEAASMSAKMYADYQKEKVLGGIKKSLKKGLDLDELSVKTSGTDEKGRRIDNSVTVGKYVNDKLFVNYTETKEENNDDKVKSYKFNYKLNKNTDLDIKESNSDGSSVGVKVKRNF